MNTITGFIFDLLVTPNIPVIIDDDVDCWMR
jgi:hypothetical protein